MSKELTEEQIYKKIEEIYNSEKGKGFITHLIRSYFPVNRSNYMFSRNDKKAMFCAITRIPLVTKDDVINFNLENMDKIFDNFIEKIQGKDTKDIVTQQFKGKMIAIECENSTKLLSPIAYRQLYNFVTSEILKQNKHISFVINDERKKEVKANIKHNPVHQPKKEQEKKVIHRSTTKLGDMDALAQLREKLQKEENNK